MRTFAVTAVLIATLTSGGSIWVANSDDGPSWAAPDSADARRPGHGDGTNILLVGIDRRTGISAEDRERLHVGGKECNCTDVMMVAHLSKNRRRLSVVSIPRDSYVKFADHAHPRHFGKINGAYQHGGGELAVRTVEQATGLRIDHYLETDFTGFADTVDRLGGAQVCTDKSLNDSGSGLKLAAGTHRLDGRGALQYVRARHVSPPGDLGRVRRQQRLLVELMSRLRAEGDLANRATAALTAFRLLRSVRVDADTGFHDLIRLGGALGRLTARQTEFTTVPMEEFDHRVPQWGSTLLWHPQRSAALWAALREDRPFADDRRVQPNKEDTPVADSPALIRLRVFDPEVAGALRAQGFAVESDTGQHGAPRPRGGTVITYDPYWERYLPTITAALPGAQLRPVAGHGETFDVTVGSEGAPVARIVHDRSSVEGAPVPGDRLLCGTQQPDGR